MTTIKLELERPSRTLLALADAVDIVDAAGDSKVSGQLADLYEIINAQVRKPRIPEPGLWGVVEAAMGRADCTRVQFCRTDETDELRWYTNTLDTAETPWFAWDELVDPVLIREGI